MNKPMPLEKLSEYLRENRDIGNVGPLVDIGRIVVPKRSYMKWSAAFAMFLVLGIGSMTTYNLMSIKQLTVVVDVNKEVNPSQAISQIVADSQGQILAVKQKEGSTYEIKVATRKSKSSFLDWLRKSRDVKKAELQE